MSSYKQDLLDDLKNKPGYAAEYLTAAYADSTEAFLVALRDVGSARKGMTSLAAAAEVNRVNLYQMLSEKGNPGIRNISAIFGALNIRVRFEEDEPQASLAPSSAPSRHVDVPPNTIILSASLANRYGGNTGYVIGDFAYFYDTQTAAPGNSNIGFGFDRRMDQTQLGTAQYVVPENPAPLSPYRQLNP